MKSLRLCQIFLFIVTCNALFEDQVGKWDWRRQYVGSVRQALFTGSRSRPPTAVLVATGDNVVANIALGSSNLNWRNVQEEVVDSRALITMTSSIVVALSADGRTVRAWDQLSGALRWATSVSNQTCHPCVVPVCDGHALCSAWLTSTDTSVFVLSGARLLRLDATKGDIQWQHALPTRPTHVSLYENTITLVEHKETAVDYVLIDAQYGTDGPHGAHIKRDSLVLADRHARCSLHSHRVWCVSPTATAMTADLLVDTPVWSSAVALGELHANEHNRVVGDVNNAVAVHNTRTGELTVLVASATAPPAVAGRIEHVSAVDVTPGDTADKLYVSAAVVGEGQDACRLVVYDVAGTSMTINRAWTRSMLHNIAHACPAKHLFAHVTADKHYALVIGADESATLLTADGIAWSRTEAMAHTLAMDMLDLPLTESQADVEIEFESDANTIVAAFVRRVRKAALSMLNDALTVTNMWPLLGDKLHAVIKHDLHLSDDADTNELRRDYFNMHKMLLVVTADRVIYGIDNRDGRPIWSLYTGADVTAVSPHIHVTRTTYRHGHDARVTLVLHHVDGSSVLSIDPIVGVVIERVRHARRIVHVMSVPYETSDGVHGLLLVDDKHTAQLYPSTIAPSTPTTPPIYVMLSTAHATLVSYRVHITIQSTRATVTLNRVWQTTLRPADETLTSVSVTPIDAAHRVHSQGRVLGDRSVLYKYVNRNQVAVLVATNAATLYVYIVDSVSGAVLLQQKHVNTVGPFHVVHCENWLLYTMYNDKSRRNELAVVELYEGAMQTDGERFSSLAPTLHAPIIERQSYIFPHGVTAAQVTDTERGLTNRMLLFALPMGAILQMPKAFLDPRRPIKPTPEHREEGVIPYTPELPLSAEHIVNYNQTTLRVRTIISKPSGLESTTLMCAAGLDMFYTRLTPSGTFDILKDDFDHWLISGVLVALFAASVITKRVAKNRDLSQAWK